jgi:hypothetical protein
MAGFDLYELRNVFTNQGILICFNGQFSHSVIEELGVAVRKYLASDEAPKDRIADVFAVFVEQAQNLKNYTAEDGVFKDADAAYRTGTLAIARGAGSYTVSCGNHVRNEDIPQLTGRLDEVRGLDKTELRKLYKRRLRAPETTDSGGAGLGIIDMARKASQAPDYSLKDLGDGTHFFHISVTI